MQVKKRITAWLVKGLLYTFAALPLPLTHRLATGIGLLLNYFARGSLYRHTCTNIDLCLPHLTPIQRNALIKNSLIETCKTFAELGAIWLWSGEQILNLVKQVSGEEHLQAAVKQGKGVILLTPHLGSWEMAGLYASSRYRITSWYRPLNLPDLHPLVLNGRQKLGARLVPTDGQGIRAIYQALQRNELAGILPDHVPSKGAGVFAPFFNTPAYTIVTVARLAQKNQIPVILTYAERLPQGAGFHLHFLPTTDGINGTDTVAAATALNTSLEQCIQSCLSQYQWSYKRFKVRPEGMSGIYQ